MIEDIKKLNKEFRENAAMMVKIEEEVEDYHTHWQHAELWARNTSISTMIGSIVIENFDELFGGE